MKKIKVLLLTLFTLLVTLLPNVRTINASTMQLQIEYPDGYSTGRLIYGNGSGQVCEDKQDHRLIQVGGQNRFLGVFRLNGEIVYCIQPFVETKSGYLYTTGSIENVNIDSSLLEKLELASYFGYGYKGDYSTISAIATQHTIWEYQGATVSDITQEVRDRIDLIKQRVWDYQNKIKPSFSEMTFTFQGIGKEYAIQLEDANNVLKDWFLVNSSEGLNYEIHDNVISIWVNKAFFDTKTIDFDLYDPNDDRIQGNSILYINPQNAQQLVSFSNPVKRSFKISFNMATGSLEITKFMNSNSMGTGEQFCEKGAEFIVVKDSYVNQYGSVVNAFKYKETFQDYEYDYLITDENGYVKSKLLGPGNYVLKQVKGAIDTLPLDKEYRFSIQTHNQLPFIYTFTNVKYSSLLKVVKKDENGNIVVNNPASFKIKNENGEYLYQNVNGTIVDKWSTDTNGILILPFFLDAGKYFLEEIESPQGFVLQKESIPFVITNSTTVEFDQNNRPITIVEMTNEMCKGSIIVSKIFEKSSSMYGEGVKFALYANMDIYSPTNHQLIYRNNDVVGIYKLDDSGILKIDGLPMGYGEASYRLKEISTFDNYQWNDQEYIFDFKQEYSTQKIITIQKEVNNFLIDLDSKIYVNEKGDKDIYGENDFYIKDDIFYKGLHPNQTYILKGKLVDEKGSLIVDENGKQMETSIAFTPTQKDGKISLEYKGDFKGYKDSIFVAVAYLYNDKSELICIHDNLNDLNQMLHIKTLYDIEIHKVDINTKEKIKDYFVFTIYKDEDCIEEWKEVASQNGCIFLGDMKYGVYYLKETYAPTGYRLSDTVHVLTVDETGVYFNDEIITDDKYILKIENQKYETVSTGNKETNLLFLGLIGSMLLFLLRKN